jgi:hypothetical protein
MTSIVAYECSMTRLTTELVHIYWLGEAVTYCLQRRCYQLQDTLWSLEQWFSFWVSDLSDTTSRMPVTEP